MLIITAIAVANPDRFSVIRPVDYSMVEGELSPLVIKLNGNIDAVTIARNKDEVFNIAGIKGKEYLCKTVKLNFGPNEIVVSALENGRVVESRKVTVFYRADISKEFRLVPPEFQKKLFHREDSERACMSCHKTNVSAKDLNPQKPGDSVCYPCHKKITDYGYVHGPAARWDCLECHNQNSKPVKYITQQPERDLCFVCHKDKKRSGRPKSIGMGLLQQGNAVYAITPMPQTIFHGSRNRHGICALHATKTGPQAGMLLQDLFLVLLIPQKAGPTLFVQERSFHVQAVIIPMPLIQGRFLPTMKSVLIACAGCAIKNR